MLDKIVEKIVESMEDFPEDWELDDGFLKHKSGLEVWLGGGKGYYRAKTLIDEKFSKEGQSRFDDAFHKLAYRTCKKLLKY